VILLLVILLVSLAPLSAPWSIALILVGCGLEVIEIGVLRRWSRRLDRRTKRTTGAESMIGATAEVVEVCDPRGLVRVHGELWEARCEAGAGAGDSVRIESLDGLTVVVVH
jgi:membrane protein implicated in regulation of membrane protease activity